jgi:hypothetical protein
MGAWAALLHPLQAAQAQLQAVLLVPLGLPALPDSWNLPHSLPLLLGPQLLLLGMVLGLMDMLQQLGLRNHSRPLAFLLVLQVLPLYSAARMPGQLQ